MKQLVVEKNNPEPILWDTPIPKPGPGEILIKNHYSVVSTGTEIATIESSNKSMADKLQDSSNIEKGLELFEKEGVRAVWNAVFPKNISPIQLGYSSSGKVIEVGRDVKNFHVGDMVVSNGNHAEYVVVNQKLCSRIPEETSPKDAAYTVLGSIALHGLRLSETSLGSRIVVVGLGIVGQLVCRLAEAQGSEVFGIDPDVARRKDNKNFFPSIDDLPVDEVDSIIITAASNSNEPIEAATKIARNKSKIVVVGDIPLNISRNEFYYKELELVVSKSYGPGRYDKQYEVLGNDYPIEYVRWTENRNFEAFLKLLSQGQISIQGLITNEIDFEESPEVYNSFNSEEKPLSVLIRYDLKSEPKIQFEKNDIVPENNQKIKVGVIGAGNFAQHFNHADLVIKAINAGKAVYVEKPLAIDVDSITRIEEAMYNAEDPKIFLGFNRRFSGASQFIKEKLNTYPANAINFRFSVPKLERDHWTNIKEIGGGRIVGEAIHAIDLGTYFFESLPQSISSHSPINKDSGEVYDNQVFININYTNGSHAAIQYFSDTNDNLSKERLEIHGNDNSFIVEDFKLMRYLIGPDDKSKVFSDGKGHKQTIETFFSYVNNEIPNPYTWLEIKSVSLAGIYAQNYLNSGIQKSIF